MIIQYNYPTTILYGVGARAQLGERLVGAGKPFLFVTDPGLEKMGLAEKVRATLAAAGLKLVSFSDVHANPVEADVRAGVAAYRAGGAHGIIALGGGSAIDAAKVIAVAATHEGPLSQFDDTQGGDKRITQPLPPIYAIPTTAGTGSEVGRSGVIIAEDTRKKTIIFHPKLMPSIAVLDPELTVGLPPVLTAATGLDAFTHSLEAYLAVGFHPMADGIALAGMELVVRHLPRAVADGNDLEARGHMLIASAMGATAFQKGLGVVHSLAHPLSTHYGIHHGLANALLLARVLAWQLDSKRSAFDADLEARYRRVARLFPGHDQAGVDDLPQAVAAFCQSVGLTGSLGEHGLVATDVPALADEAFVDPCHTQNPIPMTRDDLVAAYRVFC